MGRYKKRSDSWIDINKKKDQIHGQISKKVRFMDRYKKWSDLWVDITISLSKLSK